MKVLKNNYIPPVQTVVEKTVTITAYHLVCPHCGSELEVKKSDLCYYLYYNDYYTGRCYICPCCHNIQPLHASKPREIKYTEKISESC